ncbi:MAG TPA: hypothetical protein VH186_28985 [Chloroflexia bacterium]|nr:hypothetical protein [Chloroflexia bacterium]
MGTEKKSEKVENKLPYKKPQLKIYGDIKSLTLNTGKSGSDHASSGEHSR